MNFLVNYINQTRYMQYLIAIIGALSGACNGIYSSWASPSLPKLTSGESTIGTAINAEETSWILSTMPLGVFCVACTKAICADVIGRKTWMLLSGLLYISSWIIKCLSKSVISLCIGRFVGGMAFGIVIQTVPVYTAEIVEKDIRGRMVTAMGILQICGSLFVFTVGPFVSYLNFTIMCGVLPAVFLVLLYFIPESPYYSLMVGRKNEACDTLTKLASKSVDKTFVNNRLSEIEDALTSDTKIRNNVWECISKRKYRKPILLLLGAKTLLQLCGFYAVEAYAQMIIIQSNSSISSETSSVLFGLIQLPAAILVSLLIDKVGRKPLWITSACGCFTSLFGLGLYFYWKEMESFNWLPTTCILLYFLMIPLGIMSIPLLLVGEIFPPNIRSVATSLTVIYNSIIHFSVLRSFGPITLNFGIYTAFWAYAIFCALGICFIVFAMPETKGKTLEEIQQILHPKKETQTLKENS